MAGEIASIQVLEDNGGGLHMACFNAAGDVTNFFSGLERLPAGTMEREVVAAMTGGVDGWDNGADDAQAAYDNLTSHRHGWTLVAEHNGGALENHPENMGYAAAKWAGLKTGDEPVMDH